jgi:FkbM family methyltransferase
MYYSQYKQDEILENNIFKGYKNGFYMDIGAHDGISINNTLYFEKNNHWKGVNIEPIKSVYDQLSINRPNDINLNVAISNIEGESDFLQNTGYTEMLSGLISEYDIRHKNRISIENNYHKSTSEIIKVKTRTIESICDEYSIKHINYLSIDVEGGEFNVIKSINFDKIFIDIIEFENNYDDITYPIIKYLENHNFKVLNFNINITMINNNSKFI